MIEIIDSTPSAGAAGSEAEDLDECGHCGKPQTYPGEHAECEDCGDAICDDCIVAGVDVPGWHNGDFHCPTCEKTRQLQNNPVVGA